MHHSLKLPAFSVAIIISEMYPFLKVSSTATNSFSEAIKAGQMGQVLLELCGKGFCSAEREREREREPVFHDVKVAATRDRSSLVV